VRARRRLPIGSYGAASTASARHVRQACLVSASSFSETIALGVPAEYAFDYLADPLTAPIIDPAVIEYLPDRLPMQQGTHVQIHMRAWGVPTKIETVVTNWEPGKRMDMRGVRPTRPITVTATHTFDTIPQGCLYTWAMTFQPNAPLGRLAAGPSRRFMQRNARRQQIRFKTHVETRWRAEPKHG
jgi:hypothetical protein